MCRPMNPSEVPVAVFLPVVPLPLVATMVFLSSVPLPLVPAMVFLSSVPLPLVLDGQVAPVPKNIASAQPMQDAGQGKYAPNNATVGKYWRTTAVVRLLGNVATDTVLRSHASLNNSLPQYRAQHHLALCVAVGPRCQSRWALGSKSCIAAGLQPMFCAATKPVAGWGSVPDVPEGHEQHLAPAKPLMLVHAAVNAPGPATAR